MIYILLCVFVFVVVALIVRISELGEKVKFLDSQLSDCVSVDQLRQELELHASNLTVHDYKEKVKHMKRSKIPADLSDTEL